MPKGFVLITDIDVWANKRGKKNSLASSPGLQGVTLREENVGRKCINPHAMLRLQHLRRLAIWAGGEASIPPLAAHYGRLLAAHAQREGIPLDRSAVSCQRCETIFQPGYNCTIVIEKNADDSRCYRKSGISENNLVYTCHFCSHRNLRKGTPKGHVKDLSASRAISETKLADCIVMAIGKSDRAVTVASDFNNYNEYVSGSPPFDVKSSPDKEVAGDILAKDSPKTPSDKVSEKKMKNTGAESVKAANNGPSSTTAVSGKESMTGKRRKGWSGLREITVSSEHEKQQQIVNLTIPFLM